MFDIGWTELLVLAVAAILIVGPKDLPRMLYSLGQTVGKMRRQADEFRRQFNESMREAGMDDVRNDMKKMSDLNPANQIKDEIQSTFSDNPKSAASKAKAASEGDEAAAGAGNGGATAQKPPPSEQAEGDILAESETAATTAPSTEEDPAPSGDGQPSEPKPVSSRNVNGAPEEKTKDAVN